MKSDIEIKRDVENELRFRPDIDETDIAVKVNSAVVTLTGYTRHVLDKQRAEEAVKRVAGVANDVEVRLRDGDGSTDPQITRAAVEAIRTEMPAASGNIQVLVHHGFITLEGSVEWYYLKQQAEQAVKRLRGVMGVTNSIHLQPSVKPAEIKQRIEEAFRRSAQIDAGQITVETRGGEVALRGKVRSWSEREEAEQTAWAAPGVVRVNNEIRVGVA